MKLRSIRSVFFLLALASCKASWNDPPKPLPGQPCNELEHFCPTGKGCCGNEMTCGGEPASVGCPPASCCPIGPGFMISRDGGASKLMRMVGP
jgi:hypothetical protein